MPVCRECFFAQRMDTGNPTQRLCTQKRDKLAETQATGMAMTGKVVPANQKACEHFKPITDILEHARAGR